MSLGRSNVVDSGVELLGQVEGFGGMPLFFFFFCITIYSVHGVVPAPPPSLQHRRVEGLSATVAHSGA